MRKIKFRAWDRVENKFVIGFIKFYTNNGKLCFENETGIVCMSLSNRIVLEQYTGLKDKNGKEIYEGDIVKSGMNCKNEWIEYNAIIKWDDIFGMWIQYICEINDEQMMDVPCEVIGNIHENPELLK